MPPRKPEPTPADLFLAPLSEIARRDPEIETLVFWAGNGWPQEPTETLEAEELAFYAEGLIPEGFLMEWRSLATAGATRADHIRLYVWEAGAPLPPDETGGWQVLAGHRWGGA